MSLPFQVLWGALFSSVLGFSFVTLRLSTLVLAAGGAVAVFALCRALGSRRDWAALAAAAWLFNPLAYVLAGTFMTDVPFAALLAIASALYVRGLGPDTESPALVMAGSGAAAAAFLVRQHGLLIPISVLAFLVVARRLRV
ncbi:MAG: glycosyltransferase family 39 protein, partial [Actinomycetota bacterium]|nr:glycosyltransferase family 39 protein [Actinomycetota bacterium]